MNTLYDRSLNYESVVVDGDIVHIPVMDDIVLDVVDQCGVNKNELENCILNHQSDLFDDGTRIGFVGYLLENNIGDIVGYTDNCVYLLVDNSVWEQERQWSDVSDTMFDALVSSYSKEVDEVLPETTKKVDSSFTDGYVVGVDFPILTVDEHEEISIDPYPIAERSEFLRFETGLSKQKAQVQAMTEAVSIHAMSKETEYEVISDVLSIPIDEVKSIQNDLNEWRERMTHMFQDFADVNKSDSAFATSSVFGRAAEFNKNN